MFEGLAAQLNDAIDRATAGVYQQEIAKQASAYRDDITKQASAIAQAGDEEAKLAINAKAQYNMKATMLENTLANQPLPQNSVAQPEKPKPSISTPILFLGLGTLGYLYWKGKIKL